LLTDKPYGVDVVIPGKYEGIGAMDASKLEKDLEAMIPDEHRKFVQQLPADHDVPELPDDAHATGSIGWTLATATPLLAAGGIGTGRQTAAALAVGAPGVWPARCGSRSRGPTSRPLDECLLRSDESRHRAITFVDRKAMSHGAQRLDRGSGAGSHARSAERAVAVHGHRRCRVAPAPLRRQGSRWASTLLVGSSGA
jgi:hypothetical protein